MKECRSCRIELGLQIQTKPPAASKETQEKAIKARTGIKRESSKKVMLYRTLFNNDSLKTPEMKLKQREAKLGKTGELANRWAGGYTEERVIREKTYRRNYKNNRLKNDPSFLAIKMARERTRQFLKYNKKNTTYSKRLGCSHSEFKSYIESKFIAGMSWNNYGEWHLDHIFPLSVAYEMGKEKFAEACNYKNIQPLWAEDNISKSNKIGGVS